MDQELNRPRYFTPALLNSALMAGEITVEGKKITGPGPERGMVGGLGPRVAPDVAEGHCAV